MSNSSYTIGPTSGPGPTESTGTAAQRPRVEVLRNEISKEVISRFVQSFEAKRASQSFDETRGHLQRQIDETKQELVTWKQDQAKQKKFDPASFDALTVSVNQLHQRLDDVCYDHQQQLDELKRAFEAAEEEHRNTIQGLREEFAVTMSKLESRLEFIAKERESANESPREGLGSSETLLPFHEDLVPLIGNDIVEDAPHTQFMPTPNSSIGPTQVSSPSQPEELVEDEAALEGSSQARATAVSEHLGRYWQKYKSTPPASERKFIFQFLNGVKDKEWRRYLELQLLEHYPDMVHLNKRPRSKLNHEIDFDEQLTFDYVWEMRKKLRVPPELD